MSDIPPPLPKANKSEQKDEKSPLSAKPRKRKSRFHDGPPEAAKKIAADPITSKKQDELEKALLLARKYTEVSGTGGAGFEAKVPIPDELLQDTTINFVGLIIGPGGQTQKKLQRDLQCRINILGPGGTKVSKDSCEGLYFLISATTQQKLDVAVAYLTQLNEDPEQREALQIDQRNSIAAATSSEAPAFTVTPISNIPGVNGIVLSIPADKVGLVIGKGGETVQEAMRRSGALIRVEREHNPAHPTTREVQIQGTNEQIEEAKKIVMGYCCERMIRPNGEVEFEEVMAIPQNLIGIIIGKSGETIKNMQKTTRCSVQIVSQNGDVTDPNAIKVVKLRGTTEEIGAAKAEIGALTSRYRTHEEMLNKPIGNLVEIIAIPNNCVGTLLGKGGESVKRLAFLTGTRVQVLPAEEQPEEGFDATKYKKVSVRGDRDCIERAKAEVQKLIDMMAASSDPKTIVNPQSATTPEEAAQLMQRYIAQQTAHLPEWAMGSSGGAQGGAAYFANHSNYNQNYGVNGQHAAYMGQNYSAQTASGQYFDQNAYYMAAMAAQRQGAYGQSYGQPQAQHSAQPAPPPGPPPSSSQRSNGRK